MIVKADNFSYDCLLDNPDLSIQFTYHEESSEYPYGLTLIHNVNVLNIFTEYDKSGQPIDSDDDFITYVEGNEITVYKNSNLMIKITLFQDPKTKAKSMLLSKGSIIDEEGSTVNKDIMLNKCL
jgi:hypothetical protein